MLRGYQTLQDEQNFLTFFFGYCIINTSILNKIFEELSTSIEWIAVNKLGIQAMVHVLDDFLLIEQSKSLAVDKFAQFIDLNSCCFI
jgi:hypothetical protein